MSVPAPLRGISKSQYLMTALELGYYLFDLVEYQPKRRDKRLNDPITQHISRTILYSIRCNNLRINTEDDYLMFMRSAQEAINNIDMVETLMCIWFNLQEKKAFDIKNKAEREKFTDSYEYVTDFVSDKISDFREYLDHSKNLVRKAWSRKVGKGKVRS